MLFSLSLVLLVLSCLLAGELGPQFLSSSSTTGRHFGAMAVSQGGDGYRDDQEMTEEQAEKIRILTEMIRSRTSLECRTAIEAAMSDGSEIPERCKEEVTEIYSQLVKEDEDDLGTDDGEYDSPQGDDSNRRSREQQRSDMQSNNQGNIPLPSKQWVSAQMAIIVFIVSTISVVAFICYKNRALIFAPPAERPKEKKDKDKQKRR